MEIDIDVFEDVLKNLDMENIFLVPKSDLPKRIR
jgi:hypothetical protein